jgi:hypothetical protein
MATYGYLTLEPLSGRELLVGPIESTFDGVAALEPHFPHVDWSTARHIGSRKHQPQRIAI